jgi:hypothetical protein
MSKRTLVFEDHESPISFEKYEKTPEEEYIDSPLFEGRKMKFKTRLCSKIFRTKSFTASKNVRLNSKSK